VTLGETRVSTRGGGKEMGTEERTICKGTNERVRKQQGSLTKRLFI